MHATAGHAHRCFIVYSAFVANWMWPDALEVFGAWQRQEGKNGSTHGIHRRWQVCLMTFKDRFEVQDLVLARSMAFMTG
jgi:hypothetical protein